MNASGGFNANSGLQNSLAKKKVSTERAVTKTMAETKPPRNPSKGPKVIPNIAPIDHERQRQKL